MTEREMEIAYEESEAQELEGLRSVIQELKQTNKVLIKEIEEYEEKINKAIKYIEKFVPIDTDTILMRERQRDYLLKILKGEE